MHQKTAIIFTGIQASGKSTFYHERFKDYAHINLDTLHTRNKENILLQECVESGRSFVVDNTNPTRADREKYIRAAKDNGFNPVKNEKVMTQRRELFVDYEIPLGEDYREFVLRFLAF